MEGEPVYRAAAARSAEQAAPGTANYLYNSHIKCSFREAVGFEDRGTQGQLLSSRGESITLP